ncbi:type I toxin-antitoxin system Hok family toxin [Salmonella enterica]|nr:type I toxin-antitoxin system Hok family toxin [Salmonella enterica]
MKLPQDPVVLSILIVCITLLLFTWLTRSSLCELRLKDGGREIAAKLACGSSK